MQDFFEFLHNSFIAHISEHFFSTFLKPFSEFFQIFSKFHQVSTQFLHTSSRYNIPSSRLPTWVKGPRTRVHLYTIRTSRRSCVEISGKISGMDVARILRKFFRNFKKILNKVIPSTQESTSATPISV